MTAARYLTALLAVLITFMDHCHAKTGDGGKFADYSKKMASDEVIVKFVAGASDSSKDGVLSKNNGRRQFTVTGLSGDQGELMVVKLNDKSVKDAIKDLGADASVEYVEPNYILEKQGLPVTDPRLRNGELWGMYGSSTQFGTPANQFGSNAIAAWYNYNMLGSTNVFVGVIDEGIQITHPDLVSNIWTNSWDPVDGRDNNGNGFTDDINGWDFHNNDRSVYDAPGDHHGTHVAGTIGAVQNGQGVVGVCPRVRIIPAKFLGSQGGFTSNAVRAVNYLTGLRQRHGLRIVTSSNSWGGGGYSDSMFNAIRNAGNAGILFVAAAGNNARDVDGNAFWPCSYARQLWNVICVAALRSNGNLAGFSNWGRNTVLLAAPGEGILSTLPTNGYGVYSGTSMAAPHVSGAIALYASRWPGASAMQIRNALIRSVMPTASLQGRTITGGRLDVNRFLATAP